MPTIFLETKPLPLGGPMFQQVLLANLYFGIKRQGRERRLLAPDSNAGKRVRGEGELKRLECSYGGGRGESGK
jgi:hypothetical protein